MLSKNQRRLLKVIGDSRTICQYFYLTGGTALAEYYLHHRYSEDLDFFSEASFKRFY
ncbi:MAG: nucleotidyl transferase AbiEii/AbiGii toxin family protein [Candidatus Magasanikbacteria bacterium]|nr:nucleotidyl transferase AbiEii/AbiGii toxin family protein [Candidatus Magasanikbacteria bacterium]